MLRGMVPLLGLAGVLWVVIALPPFWSEVPARDMSARILADDRFKPNALRDALVRIEGQPRPLLLHSELVRSEALVRLRSAEDVMMQKRPEDADREVASAVEKVRSSLSLNPSDSFLWLTLYAVEIAHNGVAATSITYLEQSYAVGPVEGWVALRRNRLALAIFSMLPAATREAVVTEFARLVDSQFIEDAATNLVGVGWAQKERLLVALEGVDINARRILAKRLSMKGVKVDVPGIETDERPWW
ncbi:hypothetical protein [Bradyrhizobium elkanii]|uniref:hypothetical protein n=1 Tax=Bradyrhizobium elkanii TaxID=29448 RepID=UPI0012BC2BE4|nr:hypothetical protein [Bradyrhizobium elkanii]